MHLLPAVCVSAASAGESLIVNPSFEEFVGDAEGAVIVEQPIGTFNHANVDKIDFQFAPPA